MTYQALTTAITGLRAAQQQLSTISNNVTNATTPGYNRQIVPQKTQLLRESGQTVGVLTQSVIRVVDMNLQRDLWTQVSISNFHDVQVQYLQQVQSFHGPPDKDFSIASKLTELKNSFAALSDLPDDTQTLEATLNQAHIVADKFNDYADLLTQLRNDAQNDLETSVNRVNSLIQEIVDINIQIRGSENIGRSVAGLQDERDIAIKALTEEIDISFFERADGVLVVQTRDGLELAGDVAHSLEFNATPISALQYYPATASALNLLNITNNTTTTIDITERGVGGRMGGLIELRDSVLPSYQAQLDELAFQTANRLALQGLELFTDQSGLLPQDGVPDPNTVPTPTSVPYVDFARNMQVNSDIDDNITLLQSGTYNSDVPLPSGDNSVIRRVIEFGFGDVHYQEAQGTIDLLNIGPAADLQEWLGLNGVNQVTMGLDFTQFDEIGSIVLPPPIPAPPVNEDVLLDVFQDFFLDPTLDRIEITFEEPRAGSAAFGPTTIELDLSDAQAFLPPGPGITAGDQIVAYLNDQIVVAGLTPDQASVSLNPSGQLVFESLGNITFGADPAVFPEAMTPDAIDALGLVANTQVTPTAGNFVTEDPSFTVQIGNSDPVTITIEPGDTITELEDKLTLNLINPDGVPGLFVEVDPISGELRLRPGIDDTNWVPIPPLTTSPFFGGDLTITSGPITTSGAANAAIIDGVNVVSALFGSFSAGPPIANSSPITDIPYSYQEVVPVPPATATFTNFRNEFLGPNAAISTDIFSATNIIDYAQKVVNETSQDYLQAQSAFDNEDTLRGILQRQFSDESGVNIDEEMSNLIVVQTAYAAAARTVTAADEMFQELINSIRR